MVTQDTGESRMMLEEGRNERRTENAGARKHERCATASAKLSTATAGAAIFFLSVYRAVRSRNFSRAFSYHRGNSIEQNESLRAEKSTRSSPIDTEDVP